MFILFALEKAQEDSPAFPRKRGLFYPILAHVSAKVKAGRERGSNRRR
jgi:hypothetical protein